jgi:tetratricopeptide (TPR) repeat protein
MYSFVADHFQYLASLGLIVLGVAVITTWLDRARPEWKPAGRVAGAALVAVLAVLSWRQAHLYVDLETLYRDVIARNPSGSMAYVNLGSAYARQGRNADAIDVLSALLAHPPDPPTVQSKLAIAHAHYEIGRAHAAQGRLEEAIADYRAALADYQALPGAGGSAAKAYQMLGVAYIGVGRYAEAITALNAALAVEPGLAEVHYNLGVAHAALGELPSAASAYRAAIAIQPDYPEAYNNLGLVYGKMGRIPAAIAAYRTAIGLRPDFAAAYNNLGSAYAAEGNNDEAIAAWTRAVRSDANGAAGRAARANLDTTRARLSR